MSRAHLILARDAASITKLAPLIQRLCKKEAIPRAAGLRVALVVEELLANIVQHALRDREECRVEIGLARHGSLVTITINDDAPHFNLMSTPRPDVTAPLAARAVGGLGIHLVRHLCDGIAWSPQKRGNRVTLKLWIPA